jgi:hypothetical protein
MFLATCVAMPLVRQIAEKIALCIRTSTDVSDVSPASEQREDVFWIINKQASL